MERDLTNLTFEDLRLEARVVLKLLNLLPEGPFKDRIGMGRIGPLGIGPPMILAANEVLLDAQVEKDIWGRYKTVLMNREEV